LVFFAAFLAAYASFNERKSRRILSVLSKGVTRGQYIAGLLCGIFSASGLQVLGLALGGSWIASRLSLPLVPLWIAAALLWIACCLAATVATFFSAFLHPLLAMVCASIVIALPIIAAHLVDAGAALAMPVYSLISTVIERLDGTTSRALMPQILIALLEGIIFALLAARVFQKRDIAVPIE